MKRNASCPHISVFKIELDSLFHSLLSLIAIYQFFCNWNFDEYQSLVQIFLCISLTNYPNRLFIKKEIILLVFYIKTYFLSTLLSYHQCYAKILNNSSIFYILRQQYLSVISHTHTLTIISLTLTLQQQVNNFIYFD